MMTNLTYKSLHEAFVSNNTGSSPAEILAIVVPWMTINAILQIVYSFQVFCFQSTLLKYILEYFLCVVVNVFIFTIGTDQCAPLLIAFGAIFASVVALKVILAQIDGSPFWPKDIWDAHVLSPDSQIGGIHNVRAHLCFITCLCILAVDFQVFPRRFSKTETYGYGLMDVGIGFFMLVNGITAPETRKNFDSNKRKAAFKKSFMSSIPILIIGIGRSISVKALNYQEHVTEYGVHWNFFISLAICKISCSFIYLILPAVHSWLMALFIIITYQLCLHFGLRDVIFYGLDGQDARINFFDANREGIASIGAFVCLYMLGVQFGHFAFRIGPTLRSCIKAAAKSGTVIIITGSLTAYCHFHIEPASRRLVNITYILWTTFVIYYLSWFWFILDILDAVLQHLSAQINEKFYSAKANLISRSLSYNFLLTFLIANVLTGVVNLSMSTISASETKSLIVLTIYTFLYTAPITFLYHKKLQVKLM